MADIDIQALGSLGGKKGAAALYAKMTPEERRAKATNAAMAGGAEFRRDRARKAALARAEKRRAKDDPHKLLTAIEQTGEWEMLIEYIQAERELRSAQLKLEMLRRCAEVKPMAPGIRKTLGWLAAGAGPESQPRPDHPHGTMRPSRGETSIAGASDEPRR